MHPHTFYSTLFSPTKRNEVFVIMSFAAEFEERWQNVIMPAVEDDLKLTPHRVDYQTSGESIVHDILDGIAHAKLILADISSSVMADRRGKLWPQRNGNVMWELGIAHLMRLPDEVIVIKSDADESIFDLTQFRAFQYDPSDTVDARLFIKNLATDRLTAVDQTKSDYVNRCVDSLEPAAANFLLKAIPPDGRLVPLQPNMENALLCRNLYELGLVRTASVNATTAAAPNTGLLFVSQAQITPLGREVMKSLAIRMGIWEQIKHHFDQ